MDKEEKLSFTVYTEDMMQCVDCANRGSLSRMPAGRCEMYPTLKPIKIILGTSKDCFYYMKDTTIFK